MKKLINVIRRIFKKYKTVIYNFSYLSLFQVFLIVLPLLIYPYLIKILGVNLFGEIVYVQAIILYFSMVINFGFNITATKEIAENINDSNKVNTIVSSVIIIKLFLWFFCLVILLFLLYFLILEGDWRLFLLSFLITFNEFLFPQWFFQGIEKMKYITFINVFTKTIFTCLIFIFVNTKEDYLYVPFFYGLGSLIGGVYAIYIIIVKENVKLSIQSKSVIKYYFLESLPIFISVASKQVYVNANKIIIGSLLGMNFAAYYDLGEKVLRILKIPVSMIGQATFPLLSKKKSISLINKTMNLSVLITLFFVIVVYIFSDSIVSYLGNNDMEIAIPSMRILSLAAILVSFNQFLGTSRLIVFGYKKYFTVIISSTSVFFCLAAFLIYYFDAVSIMSMSWLAVSVEIWVFLLMMIVCQKKGLLKTKLI